MQTLTKGQWITVGAVAFLAVMVFAQNTTSQSPVHTGQDNPYAVAALSATGDVAACDMYISGLPDALPRAIYLADQGDVLRTLTVIEAAQNQGAGHGVLRQLDERLAQECIAAGWTPLEDDGQAVTVAPIVVATDELGNPVGWEPVD